MDNLHKVYASLPAVAAAWASFRKEALALPRGGELLLAGRPLNAGVAWVGAAVAAAAGDAPVTPLAGAAGAGLAWGVRVGEDTFYDVGGGGGGDSGERGGIGRVDAGSGAVAPPACRPSRRSRSPAPPSSSLEAALSAATASSLRRAGPKEDEAGAAPSRGRRSTSPTPSLPTATASLWFADGAAAPAAAARHAGRWRRFWRARRRSVPRAAAAPGPVDAGLRLLACFLGPGTLVADAAGACLPLPASGGRGGGSAERAAPALARRARCCRPAVVA